jgi:hypothetical protein
VTDWHKSSYSGGNNECIETREHQAGTDVRDTQNRELGHLSFTRTEWNAFVEATLHSHR